MNSEIKKAIEIFKQNGIMWSELKSPNVFVSKIRKQLLAQQEGILLDVEDVVNALLYYVCVNGRYASLGACIKNLLKDRGLLKNEASPKFQVMLGESNDDDLQGSEPIENDLTPVVSRDIGPGSDAHIACMDVEEVFDEEHRTILECSLAGEQEIPIAQLTGLHRSQVQRRKNTIKGFLKRKGYTLAPVNTRLGLDSYREEMTYNFKSNCRVQLEASRRDLPEVDHRSTAYTDREVKDLSKPLAPTGDEIGNEGLGYETNIGIDTLHADDQLNTKPEVTEVSWEDFPGGVDNRPQFSQYGDPAKWVPRQDSDESIQRMCNEIFATYDHGE